MQPGPPPESQQPPRQPAAGWPPAPGPWTPAAGSSTAGPAAESSGRGRPGVVVLVALLVEIIVIAAADNQWVAQRLSDNALDNTNSVGYDLAVSVLSYQWRFSPSAGDQFHTLYGQFALLGVLLVFSAVLIGVAASGRVSFARAFFGAWTAVIVASGLGAIARGLVVDSRLLQGESRFRFGVFGGIGPSSHVFAASVALGLLVGLAAGVTAVAARREAPAAGAIAPIGPPPVELRSDLRDEYATTQFQRPGPSQQPTEQFRPVGEERDATEQFRPVGAADEPMAHGSEPTRELPVVDERTPDEPPR